MTASQSSPLQKFVRCPGCSERLGVREQDAGRKARCTKCGRVFLIVGAAGSDAARQSADADASSTAPAPAAPQIADEPELPATVTFECSLCQTRITARAADAGRKVACPDCGRRNVIPPPPKPKKAKQPAALSGEQIGLWAVDEKTWEPGFATGAALHPVECRLCQTLMYATDEQIGRELRCPDCGATTVAKRSAPKRPAGVLPLVEGEEYELDPTSAPEPRLAPMPVAIRDAQIHEHARATTVGPDGRLIVQKQDVVERPVRPAVPLVQGVWRMLFTQEVVARWGMMSILSGMAGWAIFDALSTPGNAGLASFSAIMVMIFGMVMMLLWLTFAAPTFLAVVSESAEGHDKLYDSPTWSPFDWLGEGVFLIVAVAVAGMPGMLAWSLRAPLPLEPLILIGVGVAGLIFPLAMLGALLENTALGVISPRLLSTLVKCPGPWLLFYVESALLGAVVAALAWGLLRAGPAGAVGVPLVAMGAALIYMRLLGRLAWWLSDVMPTDEEAEHHDDAAAAHPHLAAARAAEFAAREAKSAAQAK